MTTISDKSADNQSEARISLAYNKNCHLSLMTSFVKWGPDAGLSFQDTCRRDIENSWQGENTDGLKWDEFQHDILELF